MTIIYSRITNKLPIKLIFNVNESILDSGTCILFIL